MYRLFNTLMTTGLLCAGAVFADDRTPLIPAASASWADEFRMSPGLRVGNIVYLSGQVASPQDGSVEALKAAYVQTFDNIGLVLAEDGLTWADVVDMTSFHTDIEAQKAAFMEVRARYITDKPYPAWTAIDIDQLWDKAYVTEIKVVAHIRETSSTE
jgi:enamine deaminase RidA (YjgF/YER057c/UK114 family)